MCCRWHTFPNNLTPQDYVPDTGIKGLGLLASTVGVNSTDRITVLMMSADIFLLI